MKIVRKILDNKISRLFTASLTVLFVFSLSFHNHAFGEHHDNGFDSHESCGHSTEHCSACLLQGKIELPKLEFSINNNEVALHINYLNVDHIVPDASGILDQPSRAPPSV